MIIKSIDSVSYAQPMARKKYGDFGVFRGATSERMLLLKANKDILMSLHEYRKVMTRRGVVCGISVGIEETNLLYITCVILSLKKGGLTLQISIDLTGTYNYKYLLSCIENGVSLCNSIVDCYSNCWRTILYTVFDSGDMDYSIFIE